MDKLNQLTDQFREKNLPEKNDDAAPGEIVLSAVGDVMLTRSMDFSTDQIQEIRKTLKSQADVVFANLEMPFTNDLKPYFPGSLSGFAGDPQKASLLKEMGVTVCNIGTNHSLDWGAEGIEATKNKLAELKIRSFGSGKNKEDAAKPVIIQVKGKKVGFLGFCKKGEFSAGTNTYGSSVYNPQTIRQSIISLKQKVDFLILSLHTGFEYCSYPDPELRDHVHSYADLGADVVLCHHSHVLQAVESYHNSIIAFSLGNFIFDSRQGHVLAEQAWQERHETMVLEVVLKKGHTPVIRIIPFLISEGGVPSPASPEKSQEISSRLDELAESLDSMSQNQVYQEAVGKVLDREISIYKKLIKEKGLGFIWIAIRNFKLRHAKMLFAYFTGKILRRR